MLRLVRSVPVAVVVLLAATACSSSAKKASGGNTEAIASSTSTSSTTVPASYATATKDETLVDTSRPTPHNGTFAGASTRTIRVHYTYPVQDGAPAHDGAPFPVVVFSHGWTATPEVYTAITNELAKDGYFVIAPAYPLSNAAAPGGPVVTDLANQPKDVSFILDKVIAESGGSSWMHGLVDPSRIGAAGHSLGGFTTYNLAFNSTCGDARIKAAVVMSGNAGGCGGEFFTGPAVPLLAIHGDHDELIPYALGQQSWQKAKSPKFMMTIVNGKHSSEELGGTTPGQKALMAAIRDFFDNYLRGDAHGLDALKEVASQPGLTTFAAQP